MIAIRNEENFVKITEKDKVYYGGNQGWYLHDLGRLGGCGPVAIANIMAYYAAMDDRYESLYHGTLSKDSFLIHMEEVFKYVKPIELPSIVSNNIKRIPITLGVPLMSQLIRGTLKFAWARGMELNPIKYSGERELESFKNYIRKALEEDCPIALLIYRNKDVSQVDYEDFNGKRLKADIQLHWLTITALDDEADIIKASTWGGWVWIALNDLIKSNGFGGMVYFFL